MSPTWHLAALLAGALIVQCARGITLKVVTIEDPIRPGATCSVLEPMSFGSYVFRSPSKYDQVFWPVTDPRTIWFCPASGFTALVGDVEDLTDAEKVAIRSQMAASYRPGKGEVSLSDRLLLLQLTYAHRKRDRNFEIMLVRALAFMYEEEGYLSWARVLREEALEAIRKALGGPLTEQERLEYLFVCAAYEREFGRPQQSDACLQSLDKALTSSTDERLKGYVRFLSDLKEDIARISPGGKLAPEQAERGR